MNSDTFTVGAYSFPPGHAKYLGITSSDEQQEPSVVPGTNTKYWTVAIRIALSKDRPFYTEIVNRGKNYLDGSEQKPVETKNPPAMLTATGGLLPDTTKPNNITWRLHRAVSYQTYEAWNG